MEIREPSLSLVFPDTQNKPLTHKANNQMKTKS